MLRGVREDVDARVLKAVGEWRFEPPRMKGETDANGTRAVSSPPVPVFMTITVRVR